MTVDCFLNELRRVTFENVFNPYRDRCQFHDQPDGPEIRLSNLRLYLRSATETGVDAVWLGRDCGYRGARRTGIALTDETQLPCLEQHVGVSGLTRATVGPAVKERTATEVWRRVSAIEAKVFLWNIFPFHPFECGKPMTNRPHSAREYTECKDLAHALLTFLRPPIIVGVGVDASRAVRKLGFDVVAVRHPSYGGHIQFARDMSALYGPVVSTPLRTTLPGLD